MHAEENSVSNHSAAEESDAEGSAASQNEDEDDWEGIEGAQQGHETSGEPSAGPSGTHANVLPTGEELRKIKDAEELYGSSVFKLQVRTNTP